MKPLCARYSPIAPITILETLCDADQLGGYVLFLAQDVLNHELRYIDLINKIRAQEDPSFIILDNGAAELPEPLTPPEIEPLLDILDIDCYVLPDAMGDMERTITYVGEYLHDIMRIGKPIMRVVQGKTTADIVTCVQQYDSILRGVCPHPVYGDLWAVPRIIANDHGSRVPAIQLINSLGDDLSIHLLGMSQHYKDDIRCTSLPNVMGIDSANPVVLGLDNQWMAGLTNIPHMERGDLWEAAQHSPGVVDNIKFVRSQIMDINFGARN